MTDSSKNLLYYGDNLDVMRRHIKDGTVDLVYLDPPFNSNTNYNVLFAEKDGSKAASQIQAFSDTWTWTQESESVFAEIVMAGRRVADCLQAFPDLPRGMRHAGLSRDDGPAPGGTPTRDEAYREHIPSL
jgi:DNA modification methylase